MKIFKIIAVMCLSIMGHNACSAVAQKPLPDLVDGVKWSVVRVELMLTNPEDAKSSNMPAELRQFLEGGGALAEGTGVIIDDDADILTAGHVASSIVELNHMLYAKGIYTDLMVGFAQPSLDLPFKVRDDVQSYSAKITFIDSPHDVAILRSSVNPIKDRAGTIFAAGGKRLITVNKARSLTLALKKPRDGESVFACGFPANSPNLITTSGIIASAAATGSLLSAKGGDAKALVDVYRVDLKVNLGNSGGPLFRDSDGAVLGIIVVVGGGPGGLATVVPSTVIAEVLTKNHILWESAPGDKK